MLRELFHQHIVVLVVGVVMMVVGMGLGVRGQLFNRSSHSSFLFHILTRRQNLNRATNLDWK